MFPVRGVWALFQRLGVSSKSNWRVNNQVEQFREARSEIADTGIRSSLYQHRVGDHSVHAVNFYTICVINVWSFVLYLVIWFLFEYIFSSVFLCFVFFCFVFCSLSFWRFKVYSWNMNNLKFTPENVHCIKVYSWGCNKFKLYSRVMTVSKFLLTTE